MGTRVNLSRRTSEVGRGAIFCDDHGRKQSSFSSSGPVCVICGPCFCPTSSSSGRGGDHSWRNGERIAALRAEVARPVRPASGRPRGRGQRCVSIGVKTSCFQPFSVLSTTSATSPWSTSTLGVSPTMLSIGVGSSCSASSLVLRTTSATTAWSRLRSEWDPLVSEQTVARRHEVVVQCGLFGVERNSFLYSCFALSPEISGARTPGKLAKGAIHCLERGFVPVQTGDFMTINGELRIVMCGFTFSSMQFALLATRLCHLHFAPQALRRQTCAGVWLSVCASSACASMCSYVVKSSIDWFAGGGLEQRLVCMW